MASVETAAHHNQVPKLSGSDNYFNWKFDMEMVLIGRDLWDIVTGAEVVFWVFFADLVKCFD